MITINNIKTLEKNKNIIKKIKGSNYQQTYENIYSIHLSNNTAITFIDENMISTFVVKDSDIIECALNIEPILSNNLTLQSINKFLKKIYKFTNKILYFPLVYEDSDFYQLTKNNIYNYERLYTSITDFSIINDSNSLPNIHNDNQVFFSSRNVRKFEKAMFIKYYTKDDVKEVITSIELNSWKHLEKQDMITKKEQLIYYNELIKSGLARIAVAYTKDTQQLVSYRIDAIYNNKVHVLKNSYDNFYKNYSPGSYMLICDLFKEYKNYNYVDLYGGPGLSKRLIENYKIRRYDMIYGDIEKTKKLEKNRKNWDSKNYDNYIEGNSIKKVFDKKENVLVATSCFGLGPVGKLNAIIEYSKDKFNWYASGEEFDINIFSKNIFKDSCFSLDKQEIREFVKKYNIKYAIVVLKNKMARTLKELGIKVVYVDSLPFMWSEKDAKEGKVPYNVDVYCAQKTLELSEQSNKIFSKVNNLVWVNPIINFEINNILEKKELNDYILINVGGLHSPNTDGIDYIDIIIKPILSLLNTERIIITTSSASNKVLKQYLCDYKNVKIETLTQLDFLSYIKSCKTFMTSPGLTTILESSCVKDKVIFLPPQNISQFYNIEYGKTIFNKFKEITWNSSDLTLNGLADKLRESEKDVIIEINKRIQKFKNSLEYKKYISNILKSDYINSKTNKKILYDGAKQVVNELEKVIKEVGRDEII